MTAITTGHTNPRRTDRQTLKIQQISSGLVFEYPAPDARERVQGGGYKYVDASTPGVRETLMAMTVSQLKALAAQYPMFSASSTPSVHGMNEDAISFYVRVLPASIEAGHITLS